MANKTDNSSAFRLVAGLMALMLLIAGALLYLQSSRGGDDGSPGRAALAAASQGIPLAATGAIQGDPGGFDRLQGAVGDLRSQRRAVVALPGSGTDWDNLEQRADAVLARRTPVEAITGARDYVVGVSPARSPPIENTSMYSRIILVFKISIERVFAVSFLAL